VKAIQVGDLVQVIRACCSSPYLGEVRTVTRLYIGHGRCRCGTKHVGANAAMLDGIPECGFRIEWLKRFPPLDELERDQIVDELTCG
jgi:hypothetical protein